jgi:hypothetical protein
MMVVMIGVDPHKGSHTAVAIGAAEEPLGELRVRAAPDQAQRLAEWAARWPQRVWAVEGVGGLGHLLAQLTRMPPRPWWAAIARVMPITAAFDVGYNRLATPPCKPATDATLTVEPQPAAIMCGRQNLLISIIEVTLIRRPSSHASTSSSIADPGGPPTPTLFTSP